MSVSGWSMWFPMWVFDGNGFTMACLAVWIRNVALRWGSSAMMIRSGAVDATNPTAPVNVARISVAISGTDFTAPEADFAALIRAGLCLGRSHLSAWGVAGGGMEGLVRSWRGRDHRHDAGGRRLELDLLGDI